MESLGNCLEQLGITDCDDFVMDGFLSPITTFLAPVAGNFLYVFVSYGHPTLQLLSLVSVVHIVMCESYVFYCK